MENIKKKYLGDGLYYEYDGHTVRLFAYIGVQVYNEVFLEPEVLLNFLETLKSDNLLTPKP